MAYVAVGKSKILMPESAYWNISPSNPVYQGRRISHVQSSDATYLPGIDEQQASSSDLVRNEPISSSAIQTMVSGTVGTGMRPESQIDYETARISSKESSELQKKAEFLFNYWAASENCDISKNYTFWELENLVFMSALEFGDCFALRRFEKSRKTYSLCIQLIEAPRVDTPPEKMTDKNIRAGIKLSRQTGVRQALYIKDDEDFGYDYHPVTYKEVKFRDKNGNLQVLSIGEPRRIGETRGIPYLSVITNIIKQLGRYSESEVTQAVFNSFVAFVTKTDEGHNPLSDNGFVSDQSGKSHIPQTIEPFTNVHLRNTEDIRMLDPNRPNKNFESFFLPMMKLIGAQLQIPAQVLLMQFDASYTASMAALERAFEVFRVKRKRLVSQFHRHVWGWFWDESVARGYLKAPRYWEDPLIRAAYQSCVWTGDPCIQLDRFKASRAARELHDLGIVSKKTLTQMLTGHNYERVVAQRAKERELEPESLAPAPLSKKEQEDLEED